MKKFFSSSNNSFYPEEFIKDYKELPTDLILTTEEEWLEFGLSSPPINKIRGSNLEGRPSWCDLPAPSSEFVLKDESQWVLDELNRVREELEKVQDSDPKAVGTVTSWRDYRKALRVWKEHIDFPNKEFRPKAPDA